MKKLFITLMAMTTLFACTKPDIVNTTPGDDLTKGVLIINEGGFNKGNAELSWYLPDKKQVTNTIFNSANSLPLGDVFQSMVRSGDNLYMMINNSNKIEIINRATGKTAGQINGVKLPRYAVANGDYLFVSSMKSDSFCIINKNTKTISKVINLHGQTEQMETNGNDIFVCRMQGGNSKLVVIDATTQIVKDSSLMLGDLPQWIVKDKNNMLWVLCDNFSWPHAKAALLYQINASTYKVINSFVFADATASASKLSINKTGDVMYYLSKGGIYKMDISSSALPTTPLISNASYSLYGLGVNTNGDIYLGDAGDFSSAGYVFRYSNAGTKIDSFKAGINPNGFYFNQ